MAKKVQKEVESEQEARVSFWTVKNSLLGLAALAVTALIWYGISIPDFQSHTLETRSAALGEVTTYQFDSKVHYHITGKHMALCTEEGLLQVYPLECGRYEIFCVMTAGWGTQVWHGTLFCEFEEDLIKPQPDNGLAVKVAALVKAIPEEYHGVIPELVKNYRNTAKLGLTDEDEVLQTIMFKNRKTLKFDEPGTDAKFEAAWQKVLGAGGTLSQLLEKEFPDGVTDWSVILNAIADGLEQGAQK